MRTGFLLLGVVVALGACEILPIPDEQPAPKADSSITLNQLDFDDVPGWDGDVVAEALPAFIRSCGHLQKLPADQPLGDDERMGIAGEWADICEDAKIIRPGNRIEAKYFFESRFVPYRVGDNLDEDGLFTGYYEPELQGRWQP